MLFLPEFSVVLAFCLATIVLTITPGPDMALFVGKSVVNGRLAGMAAMMGAMTGVVIHTLAVALGLSALLAASATAFTLLKAAGAAYLVWLAIDIIRNGSAFTLDDHQIGRSESLSHLFLKGLMVNLLNPKVIMFFVTFLPQFVAAGDPNAANKLIFLGLLFVLVAAPICALMVMTSSQLAAALKRSPRIMRIIDYTFAGIIAGFAVRLLVSKAD